LIVSKTGYRLSLFGGGCDIKSYFELKGAFLIGASLDKFCYVTVKDLPNFSPNHFEAYYSRVEKVKTIEEIQNPGIRSTLQFIKERHPELNNVAVYIQNSLPAQSGLGSSSAMIVGLLNALYHYLGYTPSKRQLAQDAIYIERTLLNEPGGWQDQVFAAYGHVSTLEIEKDGYFNVRPLAVSEDFLVKLKKSCVMFYLGGDRDSFEISRSYNSKDAEDNKDKIQVIARQAKKAFEDENISEIGYLMHDSWVQKRGISNLISNSYIDDIYNKAVCSGALGGKVMGAGGSGFLFCICEDGKRRQELINSLGLPFIEPGFNFEGSKIILI
jgi:D-glycero-alpha-D-manno-heptose-7-phosphate kinase